MSIKLFSSSQILKGDETLEVLREGTQIPINVVYVNGKPIKRNSLTFKVIANVQPVGGRDLLLVPELDRFKEQYFLFLNNSQFPIDQGLEVESISTILVNDQISRLGVNYQVQNVENWGSFSKARMMRIDTGPNKS